MKLNCPMFKRLARTPSPILREKIVQQETLLASIHAKLTELVTEKTQVFVDPEKLKEARNNASGADQALARLTRCQNALDNHQRLFKELGETQQLRALEHERFKTQIASEESAIQEKLTAYEQLRSGVKDTSGLQNEIYEMEKSQANTTAKKQELESSLTTLHKQQATLEAKQDELERAGRTLLEIKAQLEAANTEAGEWRLLTKAFNRSGLPSLEISQAGPAVSEIVNELLIDCFDSNFTVEFVTLLPTAKGDSFKEAFEVLVHRGEETILLDDLSGGEQVFINQALMEALGIYSRLYSSRKWESAYIDETDGPLDQVNKLNYFKMRQRVHELCKLKYSYYISHDASVIAAIPQRICLSREKGITIEA